MFPTSEEGEWYVGDDDENDHDSRFDLNDLAMISEAAADHLEDVQEEDEDEYEAADEEEEEEGVTTRGHWDAPKSNGSRFHVERATSSDDDLKRRPQTAMSSNSVIVPTFLCPVDLPSFPERLAERGLSLEAVCVDSDGGRITGSVALADDVGGELCPIRR